MIRRRSKRGARNRGSKRLDLSDLRTAVRDRRQWIALGVVFKPDDAAAHFELVTDGTGKLVDIIVEVETIPDKLDLSCSLSEEGGWWIPPVGAEVLVALPAGEISFRPVIVAVMPIEIDNPTGEGPAVGRRVYVADAFLIHDGNGGTEPLVRKSEFEAHVHPPGGSMQAGGDAVTGDTGTPDAITGTPVLRA